MLERLNIRLPIIQAPMAGVSTPAMAAAVTNAGGLGSIGVGATDAEGARSMIADVRARTDGPFNVNLFCHGPAVQRPLVEARWIDRLRPEFEAVGARPPSALHEIYRSFVEDEAMFAMLLAERPNVVSFHFGLPRAEWIRALRDADIFLLSTATNIAEGRASSGVDAIVAQGWEAGGHRGCFDPDAADERLETAALVRALDREVGLPVIAAGGIMDGAGISAALDAGAAAAQLGTAFIACDESLADPGYLQALGEGRPTVMTRAVSGRPARCLANRFTAIGRQVRDDDVPDYPIAYDLGKALHAAARAKGEFGFGAQWAGTGAAGSRPMPAGKLVVTLAGEMKG